MLHIVTCLWIIVGRMEKDQNDTWMDGGLFESSSYDQYVESLYWSVTTITTVGYGDISANNNLEKIFCILVMIIGVICFSYASGSLSSILNSTDNATAIYTKKLQILNRIFEEYKLSIEMYSKVKNILVLSSRENKDEEN